MKIEKNIYIIVGKDMRKRRTLQINLELDIEHVSFTVVFLDKVGQQFRLILQASRPERLQCACEHDPSADRATEILGIERSQRDVLPRLYIPGGPVVQQYVSEDRGSGPTGGDEGHTKGRGGAEEGAKLEF